MHRNKSVDVHQFAMVPRADIPRSSFRIQTTRKTTFNAAELVPFFVDSDILPGDTFNLNATMFARMATPLFPIMDNVYLDTQWFFVPNRLVWDNWQKFMGEQRNPGDSISYTVPQLVSSVGGYPLGSVFDHMGLPCVGQVGASSTVSHSVLPLRAYNLIWNEWYRDENLQNSELVVTDDGPGSVSEFRLMERGKRHDYFTSCLPFVQKGTAVTVPLGTTAPVVPNAGTVSTYAAPGFRSATDESLSSMSWSGGVANPVISTSANTAGTVTWDILTGLHVDLASATAATINQLRQSFQIQKLLERDARGGTRYTEIMRSHFGVTSPDARLQRPEYLGGSSVALGVNPVSQTSSYAGGNATLAAQGAFVTGVSRNGFTQSFTEHGIIIGLCSVRADLTYQQGLRKMWSRLTRYDYYFPAFAMLGEQAVLNKEIYVTGGPADSGVFGYQERWAEYRYNPSLITGLFNSRAASTIDQWHLAQNFGVLPTLNNTFIQDRPPLQRIIAVGSAANGQQLLLDVFVDIKAARPLPMYSVPGLIDHF